jgi:hypothetical protein
MLKKENVEQLIKDLLDETYFMPQEKAKLALTLFTEAITDLALYETYRLKIVDGEKDYIYDTIYTSEKYNDICVNIDTFAIETIEDLCNKYPEKFESISKE